MCTESIYSQKALLKLDMAPTILADQWYEDSDLLVWFERELESVSAKTYETPRRALLAAEGKLLPFDTEVEDGAETFVWYNFDARGMAEFKTAYANHEIPEVTVRGAENTGKVRKMRLKYGWDIDDVAKGKKTGRSLSSMKAKEARRGHDERLHYTALWGRDDLDLDGLINHRNVVVLSATSSGAATNPTWWANKTLKQITDDVALVVDGVAEKTYMTLAINKVAIAHTQYNIIKNRKISDGDSSSRSILTYLQETFKGVEFFPMVELRRSLSNGNLSDNCLFGYMFDPDAATLVRPEKYRTLPVQRDGYRFVVFTQSSTGGVKMIQPLGFVRLEGIGND